jgi:sulfatase maturation enzyme AslB (radical SAM superfamily)
MNIKQLVQERNVCSLPWVHTDISLTNNKVTTCCKYDGDIGTSLESFPIVWARDFKKLRENLANGVPVKECHACDVPDDAFSYKKWKNRQFLSRSDFLDFEAEEGQLPKVFTFTLKNICNLACRMCGPVNSSLLDSMTRKSTVLQKYWPVAHQNNKFDVENFRGSFGNCEEIAFGGGEPTIDEDCVKLIKMAKEESKKLRAVGLNTNLAIINDEVLSELNTIDGALVYLKISFDGPSHIHNYIRYKCDLDLVIENMKYVSKTYPNIRFSINTNIQLNNVGYAIETMENVHALERELGIKFLELTPVPIVNRPHLHPSILPEHIKNSYLKKLEAWQGTTTIPGSDKYIPTAIEMLKQDSVTTIDKFIEFTNEFDRMSETKCSSVFPELSELFE